MQPPSPLFTFNQKLDMGTAIETKRQISSGMEEGREGKQTRVNINTETVDKIDVHTQGQ